MIADFHATNPESKAILLTRPLDHKSSATSLSRGTGRYDWILEKLRLGAWSFRQKKNLALPSAEPCTLWPRYSDPGGFAEIRALLRSRAFPPLKTDTADAETGIAGAARFILGCAAKFPSVRPAFQRPEQDAAELIAELATYKTLSPPALRNIRSAVEADFDGRVMQIFAYRSDLRKVFPLALTPQHKLPFFNWLTTYGVADFGMSPEIALWAFFRQDADPSRGLETSFRFQTDWQAAVPHGLTRFGWGKLKQWLAQTYECDGDWLDTATLPEDLFRPWEELLQLQHLDGEVRSALALPASDLAGFLTQHATTADYIDGRWLEDLRQDFEAGLPDALGANVLGYFRYTSGLQRAVGQTANSLLQAGVRVGKRDIRLQHRRETAGSGHHASLELFDTTIINTGLDTAAGAAYARSSLHPRADVYRIAIWWWELETLPPEWLDRADDIDEIWAPTRFIQTAMQKAFSKPVLLMHQGIETETFVPRDKSYFGMDPSRFSFGFVFDMNSSFNRKNPLDLIAAFQTAFGQSDRVELVLKTLPFEDEYVEQWEQLRDTVAQCANVRLIEAFWSRDDLSAFLNALDAYASLHRSEGLGLTCAESMLLGKPVIATAYSGNMDFMTEANSYLVDFTMCSTSDEKGPYGEGFFWAQPDVNQAARKLREVVEDEAGRVRRSALASTETAELFSVAACGRRMADRLRMIRERHTRVAGP